MGRAELLEALQRDGRETMAAIVAAGADEEKQLRSAAEARLAGLRLEHERQRELLCSTRKRTLVLKASREAALIRLRTEHVLLRRLYERASICVAQLRRDDAERFFRALAAELPKAPWRSVLCNPDDVAAATACFPAATITSDRAVSGMIVATEDGSLTVDNTMLKRLEKAWPDLLPDLMAELRGRRL